MKAIFAAGIFGAFTALVPFNTASAADPLLNPAPMTGWGGLYWGLHGGIGSGFGNAVFLSGADSPADFGVSGLYIGPHVGYNWLTSNTLLVGIEGDLSLSGITGTRNAAFITRENINWLGSVRGRVGVPMGRWVPYLTGGWGFASASRFSSSIPQTVSGSHSGWTIGVGAEWTISQNWSMKAEYKYFDLGSGTYNFSVNPSAVRLTLNTFEIGFNYRH